MTAAVPNPGSREAADLGCTCPIMDNHHGQGVPDGKGGVNFWITEGCPLHAAPAPTEVEEGPE